MHLRNKSLHVEMEDPVQPNAICNHHALQVNCTKPEMDTQLFPPLFGGITNTPPFVEAPQLYSSWSTCEDDGSAVASLQDCAEKRFQRAQVNLPCSGNGPDMFGLVSSILEEPNEQEPVTNWNSLSRLFPPVWSPDFESSSSSSVSGLFPNEVLQSKALTSLAGTQQPYEGSSQTSLKREPDDLHLQGSWLSPTDPCILAPDEGLQYADPESNFKSCGIGQRSNFTYRNVHSFDNGKSHTDISTFSSQTTGEGSPNAYKEYLKTDKAKGLLGKKDPTEESGKYFAHRPKSYTNVWEPVIQENKKYAGFTPARETLPFRCPSPYYFNPILNKENNYPEGMNPNLQETYSPQSLNTEITLNNRDRKALGSPPKGCFNNLPLKSPLQAMNSSYNGYSWLDSKAINPFGAPYVTYGKPSQSSPEFPVASASQPSGFSNPQPSRSQMSPVSPLGKDRKPQVSNGVLENLGFPTFPGNQKPPNRIGHSSNDSVTTTDRHCGTASVNSSNWLSQPCAVDESTKHHRFRNKQSQCNSSERRGKNNWLPHASYAGPNRSHLDVLRRKPGQHGDCLSDFINPSFLPFFPLVPGFKHAPNFPPFNPPPFPTPAPVGFSPLPFPLSELVDLFQYDDFHNLSPFINDLFCGDVAAPFFAFPPPLNNYRPPKNRSGPAHELHTHLEECYEQWRMLERERKKAEADLVRTFPGKRVSSSSHTPFSRLPSKPSRVDRLIADQCREQARVQTLIMQMERLGGVPVHPNVSATLAHHLEAIRATQARRKDEIINAVNLQRPGASRYNNEKDVLALAAAIKDLVVCTRKTRTALWCALQMSLPKTKGRLEVQKEELERALQELCPVGDSPQVKSVLPKDPTRDRENHAVPPHGIK